MARAYSRKISQLPVDLKPEASKGRKITTDFNFSGRHNIEQLYVARCLYGSLANEWDGRGFLFVFLIFILALKYILAALKKRLANVWVLTPIGKLLQVSLRDPLRASSKSSCRKNPRSSSLQNTPPSPLLKM